MDFPRGLAAYPITPCDASGRVDAAALRRLVGRLRAAQVDAVGLLGSTGTYLYLSRAERRRAIEAALEEGTGGAPLLVGIGALRTDEAVKLAQDAKAAGVDFGLLAMASYTPLTEAEVFEHYVTVAREGGLPLCVYDNPAATHFAFTPELLARLAQEPGIVAAKSPAASAADQLAGLRPRLKAGFSLGYSGDWATTEAMISGAEIWHSVLGGILPLACGRITAAVRRGDFAEARRLDAELAEIWALFRELGSLRAVFAMADLLGIASAAPPRPILPLAGEALARVKAALVALPEDLRG